MLKTERKKKMKNTKVKSKGKCNNNIVTKKEKVEIASIVSPNISHGRLYTQKPLSPVEDSGFVSILSGGKHKDIPELLHTPKVKICVKLDVYIKMKNYVDACNDEVGWFGIVSRHCEGNTDIFEIEDVMLTEQTVTGVTVDISTDAMTELAFDLMDMDASDDLRLWGHSHVDMGVSRSGTDLRQLMDFSGQCDWMLGVIMNKSSDISFTLIDKKLNCILTNVPYVVYTPSIESIVDEMKHKVKREQMSRFTGFGYSNRHDNRNDTQPIRSFSGYDFTVDPYEEYEDYEDYEGYEGCNELDMFKDEIIAFLEESGALKLTQQQAKGLLTDKDSLYNSYLELFESSSLRSNLCHVTFDEIIEYAIKRLNWEEF